MKNVIHQLELLRASHEKNSALCPTEQGANRHIELVKEYELAIKTLQRAKDWPKKEPVWTAEECLKVMKTIRYIEGIVLRGTGIAIKPDETLEEYVLGYVKQLEGVIPEEMIGE